MPPPTAMAQISSGLPCVSEMGDALECLEYVKLKVGVGDYSFGAQYMHLPVP